MPEEITMYLPASAAFTAMQVPADVDTFCATFNRKYGRRGLHVWSDGECVYVPGANREDSTFASGGRAAIGDWIITNPDKPSIMSDNWFRRSYLPVSSSVLTAMSEVR
jgi:hypothetical protein